MFDNQKCQYCSEVFCKNDDIVVCPKCGAPYHRKCWEEHGKCAFEDKHESGFVYNANGENKEEIKEKEIAETEDFIGKIQAQIQAQSAKENQNSGAETPNENKAEGCCEQCGAKLINGSEFCVYCGHKAGEPINARGSRKNRNGADPLGGISENETIMGEKASDIALVVRNSSAKFLPKFKKIDKRKSKISWSWPSFFFGYLYLFFRKLYKYGAIFIVAQVLIFNVVNVACGNPIGKMQTRVNDIYSKYTASMSEESVQKMSDSDRDALLKDLRSQLMDDGVLYKAYIALGASLLSTNIVCALFFNYFYLKKCIDTITKIKESAEVLGGMTAQNYKFNLMARGGISLFGLFLGYFVKMMSEYLLSYLLSLFI